VRDGIKVAMQIQTETSSMLKNYLRSAIRNFRKNKIFSFINIIGLSTGLACFIFMAVFVFDELNYDRYPADANNIYRLNLSVTGNGDVAVYPAVDFAVGQGMKNAFQEIKDFSRLVPVSDFVKYNDKQFKEEKIAFADSNFLQMFSIPLIKGNGKDALIQPNSIVVSKAFAKKYFGDEDAIGKFLIVGLHNALYKVTGVFNQVPANSHFHIDAFLSLTTWHLANPTWSNLGAFTYLELNQHDDPKKLESKFPQLVAKYVVPEIQHDMGVSLAEAQKSVSNFMFTLQPLTDIHLYSHTKSEIEPNGDIQYVYIFSVLAIFILLLACVNFTNLSIARSVKRAKEVGVRKVMGSAKIQLVKQFLSESLLMTCCATIFAGILIFFLLPYFNQVSGKQIELSYFLNYKFVVAIVALTFFVGVMAGIYPSIFLSAFKPIKVLKGPSRSGHHKNGLRSSLIVFQFFVSTALIISTIIVYQQLDYMQNKKLGYAKEQVLFLPDGRLLGKNQDAFKQEVLQNRQVISASISRSIPGGEFMDGTEVHPVNENGNGTEIHMNIYHVDYDYLNTLGMQIKQGRYFSNNFGSDSAAVVINEAAVKELGWSKVDPIGRSIVRSGQLTYKVVGVVRDFHYASAKQKIAPLMMMLGSNYGGLIVKVNTSSANITGLLNDLKSKWGSFKPQGPFSYTFLDDKFAALYSSERRTQQIFSAFALLAIIIASLGLFGLSAYTIEQRTKEIGIRKVLGASVKNVLLLVSKEFLSLVGIAFILSIPVAFWAMHRWLENYAYRINIGIGVFMVGGIVALMIAIITITFQAMKAAHANPIKSLRTE
jgi:putative ABC transport system permease protein